jgi:hypothetical protein
MMKAVVVIGMMLLFSAGARADRLNCATMIALGNQSAPRPVIVRMRLEIGLRWSRATGEPLEDANLDKILFACVDNPSSSIQDVVQTLITPKPDTGTSACSR